MSPRNSNVSRTPASLDYRRLARSSTPLIQAARFFPVASALAAYRASRSLDSRSSYRSVSPLSTGGRPLGLLAGSFMAVILCPYKYLDKGIG